MNLRPGINMLIQRGLVALCATVFALTLVGCDVPLTDEGQYLTCAPDFECRDGYECRLLDERYACVPIGSNVGSDLDAGTSDSGDVSDTGSEDTQGDSGSNDTEDTQTDVNACNNRCEEGTVCLESAGECVQCTSDEHCTEGTICTAANVCARCDADRGCSESETCIEYQDVGDNFCSDLAAPGFVEQLANIARDTACAAAFSGSCNANPPVLDIAGRASSEAACKEYPRNYFAQKSFFIEQIARARATNRTTFDRQAGVDCLAAIDAEFGATSCKTIYDDIPEVCFDVFGIQAEEGQTCENTFNCGRDQYCSPPDGSDTCGLCINKQDAVSGLDGDCSSGSGMPCDFTEGLTCGFGTRCVEWYSKTSGPCREARECAVGYVCYTDNQDSDPTCRSASVVAAGERCESPTVFCEAGSYCDGETCIELGEFNDSCSQSEDCALGYYCNSNSGLCEQEIAAGNSCDPEIADSCYRGFFCAYVDGEQEGTCEPEGFDTTNLCSN